MLLNEPFEEDGYIHVWRERAFYNPIVGPMHTLYRVFELHSRGPEWAPRTKVTAVAWRRGID